MSEIVLLGLSDADERQVRLALSSLPAGAITSMGNPDELLGGMHLDPPLVVALGPGLDGRDRFELTRRFAEVDPTVGVLIVEPPSEELFARALEAGARGVLAPQSGIRETRATFQRVSDSALRLRTGTVAPRRVEDHRTIVVVSAKGGSGKTVVAVNLATVIALGDRRRTALVDLDLQFGDVATALLLTPEHTITDAAESANSASPGATAVKVFLTRHAPTDLFVLCAPDNPVAGEEIGPRQVGGIIDGLATEFRYQVVDTSAGLDEHALAALERATDVVLIVDLDVPSVRGARKLIDALDAIHLHGPHRHLVLNRADSKVGLPIAEVAAALKRRVDVALPSSRDVPLSYNEGKPIVISKPRHDFSRGIRALAARIIASPVHERARR